MRIAGVLASENSDYAYTGRRVAPFYRLRILRLPEPFTRQQRGRAQAGRLNDCGGGCRVCVLCLKIHICIPKNSKDILRLPVQLNDCGGA